jgi:hypothetical protein
LRDSRHGRRLSCVLRHSQVLAEAWYHCLLAPSWTDTEVTAIPRNPRASATNGGVPRPAKDGTTLKAGSCQKHRRAFKLTDIHLCELNLPWQTQGDLNRTTTPHPGRVACNPHQSFPIPSRRPSPGPDSPGSFYEHVGIQNTHSSSTRAAWLRSLRTPPSY